MKVQEEDKEIALIEQSYDSGEEKTKIFVFFSYFSINHVIQGRLPRPRFVMLGQQGVGKLKSVLKE